MVGLLLQPYSASAFNTLPSLHDADAQFNESNAATVVNSILANIFTKHLVDGLLGVQLLHRHFQLSEGERLVDVGGASVPWIDLGSEGLSSRILPVSWAFEGDSYHPYEFQFVPPTEELQVPDIPEPFFVEFNDVLKAHNLQGVLGVRSLKKRGGKPEMEITNGRTNVTFDYDPTAAENETAIEASWAFANNGTPATLSYCTSYCSSRSDYGAHTKYHQRNS